MAKFTELIVRSINITNQTYVNSAGVTTPFAPLNIYLVPKVGGEHDRYVVDASGIISKQSAGITGDFIPTSGTVVGKPLTGFIETDPSIEAGFKSVNGDIERVIKTTDDAGLISYVTDTTTNKVASISVYVENISLSVNDGGSSTGLVSIYSDRVQIENSLLGSTYITPTTDNYYVQRKYITDNYVSNSALSTSLANYYTKSEVYNKAEVDAKLSAVYRPKGSVANFAALPSTGNTEGDVWNVLDTGANYVWVLNLNSTGVAGWDKLSETVDLTNYMTLNTEQITDARKGFSGATGNTFSGAAIETRGNGSTIYPTIGFHQPGLYGGTISMRSNNQVFFKNTDDTDYNYLLAKGFIIDGVDDEAVLLVDGTYKLVSDFALAVDYVKKSGDTMTGNLNALNISAQNSADKLTYDNLENYGSPLKINANASLGIQLQANGNSILQVNPDAVRINKDLIFDSPSLPHQIKTSDTDPMYISFGDDQILTIANDNRLEDGHRAYMELGSSAISCYGVDLENSIQRGIEIMIESDAPSDFASNRIRVLDTVTGSRGLTSDIDYTSNITDLDFVQKKYVDDKVGADEGGVWLFP